MIDLSEDDFASMVAEVLERLARDEGAKHLWQWRSRPGCPDEPPGPSRRRHLGALVGIVGVTAFPGLLSGCGDGGTPSPDDGGAPDGGAPDSGRPPDDGGTMDGSTCADDPCGCADDPCGCGDDPCSP